METQSSRQIDLDGVIPQTDMPRDILQGEDTQAKESFADQGEKNADNSACDVSKGERRDTTSENETIHVFEQDGWSDKVKNFLAEYPIAKDFSAEIGKIIADSDELSQDENCLEKALARTLARVYVAPQRLADDEEFLQKYVLSNESLKDRIIQDYLDGLQQNLPPKFISSRGQTTITPPSKPTSIAEAGNVFKAMFNNRRI